MSTPGAKVVLLGLDAVDPSIATRLAAAGRLPAIEHLLRTGARATIGNPYGLFVGSLWTSMFTARSPARTGFYCWEEIAPGTYDRRLTTPRQLEGTPFWVPLSDAGLRIAVIDVPHARAHPGVNGIEVMEWGCHDRHFGFHTAPPELAEEIERRHGLHPVFGVDAYAEREFAPDDYLHRAGDVRTREEERELLIGLTEGAERKGRLSAELLARGRWDLFMSVFGEGHAVGHQLWHLHDAGHPRHDPELTARLGDPLEQVYQRLDRAVGAHLERTGAETTFLVLLSHGLGPHYDANHLLHEILARLDLDRRHGPGGGPAGRAVRRAFESLPRAARRAARRPVAGLVRRAARHRALADSTPPPTLGDWTAQHWFLAPNNTVFGGVRVNLRGREPNGLVSAGTEYDSVCEHLEDCLLDLVNVETGAPVADRVVRTDEVYDRQSLDSLPDLLIEWNHDVPVRTVWSPRTGIVHGHYPDWRTGDHRPDGLGLLLATGPGLERGEMPQLSALDLAPSLAARLGVELGDVDGAPVGWLSGDAAARSRVPARAGV